MSSSICSQVSAIAARPWMNKKWHIINDFAIFGLIASPKKQISRSKWSLHKFRRNIYLSMMIWINLMLLFQVLPQCLHHFILPCFIFCLRIQMISSLAWLMLLKYVNTFCLWAVFNLSCGVDHTMPTDKSYLSLVSTKSFLPKKIPLCIWRIFSPLVDNFHRCLL